MCIVTHDKRVRPATCVAGAFFEGKTSVVLGYTVLQNILVNVYNVSVCYFDSIYKKYGKLQ